MCSFNSALVGTSTDFPFPSRNYPTAQNALLHHPLEGTPPMIPHGVTGTLVCTH